MTRQILDINKIHEVESYPYGRLRTKAFFSTEFVKGKGFRHVFQTIDPKNGRINNPKKSTYCHFAWNYLNNENGHIENGGMSFYDWDSYERMAKFIAENFEALKLTEDMIKDICATAISHIRVNTSATLQYSNVSKDELIAVIKPALDLFVRGFKTGENIFSEIKLDHEAIKNLKMVVA